ncbi:MAG: hypothetical protein B6247_08155 [Candidatus Parabeggiatoa sp. nov. 2]|nr:MAG: hypothetical protein B6247_08155 [Beggiatoa sp. 4572_84]
MAAAPGRHFSLELGAMLTLETDRIFPRVNGARNVGRISFLQRTGLGSNPRQLGAMLTLETDRIFPRVNGARNIGLFTFDKTGLGSNPRQLGAMLTLETDRIFSIVNDARNVGRISFLQRTGLGSNPRQLWAMLTLETSRIFPIVNSAKSVGHENYIDIQIINLVSFRRLELSDIGSRALELGAMLTLETDHILSRVNDARSVGHESYIDIQIIRVVRK